MQPPSSSFHFQNPASIPSASRAAATARRRKPKTDDERIELFQRTLEDCGWSLSDLLFKISDHTERGGRSNSHAQMMSRFLQGRTRYSPIEIINLWLKSPDGRVSAVDDDQHMYSLDVPYASIKSIRSSLTAFAAQTIRDKVVEEAKKAVEPGGGLHATLRRRGSQRVEWVDIGASTIERIGKIQHSIQPVTARLLRAIAGGEDQQRKKRPVDMVCIDVLSSLNFARNSEARLLPLMKGLLYFAHSAPVDLITYGSRVGAMPAYQTIYNTAKHIAEHEAEKTFEEGRDPSLVVVIQADNVQNYLRQRDLRIGRTNKMNIGIAACRYILEDVDPNALDLESKRAMVSLNHRAGLTLAYLNRNNYAIIFPLHWLRVLVEAVPQLHKFKSHVSMLFRTRGAKMRLTPKPYPIRTLATSGKNENITTELKEGLVDFLGQCGQRDGDYNPRLMLLGGDGLTFQRILELKKYLQFHEDPFQSLETVEPGLSWWHTEWTNLSRIFEDHFDSPTSRDPSTLGHSAAQIGYAGPANIHKVEYDQASEFLHLVVHTRMSDCWRNHFGCDDLLAYFEQKEAAGTLPEIEDLEKMSITLHRAYSCRGAMYAALGDTTASSQWSDTVPLGTPWRDSELESSTGAMDAPPKNTMKNKPAKGKKAKKANPMKHETPRHPSSDYVLANSISLILDGLIAIEFAYATAEGDVGRVYRLLIHMLFTFAGSSHSKYTTYLLEFLTRLELESSEELRNTILQAALVNLSGRPGGFSAADLIQEYFNRLLEAMVDKKGVDYGDDFIRTVISPNIHHFARIKLDMRAGVGLSKRSGRHSSPHQRPEVKQLLDTYRGHELHKRRPGRVYKEVVRDSFSAGLTKLQDGRLRKWVVETTSNRDLLQKAKEAEDAAAVVASESGQVNDEVSDGEDELEGHIGASEQDDNDSDEDSGGEEEMHLIHELPNLMFTGLDDEGTMFRILATGVDIEADADECFGHFAAELQDPGMEWEESNE
ncbi:hypothetical protein BKA70DRAFT_1117540 [Coprinopsis sp. MPI-PUGE-AT-0042]|nr:hypothetical protein BKA70DRAFT_1117540 [Coprinopsis sp. MPI-PUGE-AT-0042]